MTTNVICLGCKRPKYETVCCRYQAVIWFHDITDSIPFLCMKKPKLSFKSLEKYLGKITFDLPPKFKDEKDV